MNVIQQKHYAWRRGRLDWKLHKAQDVIYKLVRNLPQDQREALLFCSRRFGKSFLGVILALEDCLQHPGKQVAIIGPTLKQTTRIVTPLLKAIIADAPKGLVKQSKSTSTWEVGQSTLLLGGFDTILESMRGLDLYSIYLEESGQATADLEEYQYLLYSVLFPTLMHSRGRVHHLTTPARLVDHPLHLETLPKCSVANAFYKFTIEDNPLLSPNEIEKEIETLGGRDSIGVQRELFCNIVRDDSITVVPQFNEDLHVKPLEHQPHLSYTISGDLGYTNDLSAFHLMSYDHNTGKVLVFAEKVFPPTTPSTEIALGLQDWLTYTPRAVVDIQGNTRTDLAQLGLDTATPEKDKFESTITFIRNEFFQDKLVIDPACTLLIQTCRSLTFNKQRTDFLRTITLGHGDCLMSLVYGLRYVDRHTDKRPKPSKRDTFAHKRNQPHKLTKLGYTQDN